MKHFNRLLAFAPVVLLSAVFLSACAKVGPDFRRPFAKISLGWLSAPDERLETAPADYRDWWKGFNDPALDRIIARAYSENLTLRATGLRVIEARAQLGVTVGNLYPQAQQLSGSVEFNRTSEKSPSALGLQQHSFWQDQVNFGVAWELDFWGKFRRAVEAADAGLLAAVADYDAALVSLTADTASTYVQIRTLEKRLEIARQNAEIQTESLRIAESRFTGGVTTERDVEQARTVLYNTLSTIPSLQAELQQARHALCVLMGLPPQDLEEYLVPSRDIPAPPPRVAVGIPADLLRRRPDVRGAELRAAAQCARIGVAKAELLPAFSLTGSLGLLSSSMGQFNLAEIASVGAGTVAAGPSFQWNILNYGRITNNVRLQDALFQELLVTYQDAVLKAQQEVEDGLAAFLRAQESAEFLARSAASAKRSLELAFIQYQQGSTDFTTVLTAQQSLLTAQDNFATALGNISGNLVRVYRAIGGGWEIREGSDFVPAETKDAMAARTNWGNLLSPASYKLEEGRGDIRKPDW